MTDSKKEKEKIDKVVKEKDPKLFCEKKFVIQNKLGLHARPAALFVQTANRFQCDVEVRKGRLKVNGKSIMGIMTLAAGVGTSIMVRTEGADAVKAMNEITKLISGDFGE
ncbi:MAG: HPr family phosphocarrier protein [Candidatus Omnitrophica bacterium]|nr:HPr family phosphocarrier protein [Candidatus Omnitrophota bacterium]MDD5670294.1 HPr family phosphocarrier protein [Candidatus Omnitrophota bacterium]